MLLMLYCYVYILFHFILLTVGSLIYFCRVPGNFHIEARSKHHNLNPAMANLSHVVNELSFGTPLNRNQQRRVESLPKAYFNKDSLAPMNDILYMSSKLHQAFHHYIKVVSTQIEAGSRYSGKDAIQVYQIVQSSQVMNVSATPLDITTSDL